MGDADWYEIVPTAADIMWNPVTLQNEHPIIFENNMREQREGINKKQLNQLTLFQQITDWDVKNGIFLNTEAKFIPISCKIFCKPTVI